MYVNAVCNDVFKCSYIYKVANKFLLLNDHTLNLQVRMHAYIEPHDNLKSEWGSIPQQEYRNKERFWHERIQKQ